MIFPELAQFTDLALLFLRLVVAAVFAVSGWSHARRPVERAESIGMSPAFTLALGLVELVASASVALGVYAQIGAFLLIGVMLGAIQKKVFAWETGFWGEDGQGWYYDLLYLACNVVVMTTGGGAIRLI